MKIKEEQRRHNSTYTQVGVQCIYDSEVLNPSSVLSMKFSAQNPHLRVAAKRQINPKQTTKMMLDKLNLKNRMFRVLISLFIGGALQEAIGIKTGKDNSSFLLIGAVTSYILILAILYLNSYWKLSKKIREERNDSIKS